MMHDLAAIPTCERGQVRPKMNVLIPEQARKIITPN